MYGFGLGPAEQIRYRQQFDRSTAICAASIMAWPGSNRIVAAIHRSSRTFGFVTCTSGSLFSRRIDPHRVKLVLKVICRGVSYNCPL